MITKFANTNQDSKTDRRVTGITRSVIGVVSGAGLLGALTGCVEYAERPGYVEQRPPPPPGYVEQRLLPPPTYVEQRPPPPPAYVEQRPPPDRRERRPPPPPAYVEREPVVQDDYVYYPGYEVYYSSNRRQYMYLEGGAWVTRPAPPRVSAEVLFASPSIRLDFHDSPALHHQAVVREYPTHWAPPEGNRGKKPGRDEREDEPKPKGNRGHD